MSIAGHVESDVDALGGADARIDLVFQPVFRNFALNDLDVPAELGAKVAAPPSDAEAALRASCGERSVGAAYRSAFTEGNLVGLRFGSGLGLCLGRSGNLLRFDFGILALNLDGVGFFLFNLGLGFCQALGFVGQNVLGLSGRGR